MNKFELKTDYAKLLETVLSEILQKYDVKVESSKSNFFETNDEIDSELLNKINNELKKYAVQIVENKGQIDLVRGIKDFIDQNLFSSDVRKEKLSVLLSTKFGYSYSYLSTVFSNKTYVSIEKYFIFSRIERTKEMLLSGYSLTEIAHKLDFSSVQHLSRQFKSVTGLTTIEFLNILKSRTEQNQDGE